VPSLVDIWPGNGYKAVKKEINCLLFVANEKDILRKHELAGYDPREGSTK